MAHLVETLQSYLGHPSVEERDGVLFVLLSQNERMSIRNLGTSGDHFMNPTISFSEGVSSQTFFLQNDGSSAYYDLMAEPIVFCVTGTMDKGIKAVYEHWTKAGILHRDGAPAYQSWYTHPETGRKDWTAMYYFAGVLSRDGGPAISIYKNMKEKNHNGAGKIISFDLAVLECRHIHGDTTDYLPDNTWSRSWPYVKRLSLNKGQQLFVPDGDVLVLRETAAIRATAKWEIPEDVISGYYPQEMIMPRFHEFWNGKQLEDRIVSGNFTSKWLPIDTEDKRKMPPFMQTQKAVSFSAFDEEFMCMIPRMGLTEKPFYDDADVEFAVLTDLSKYIEEAKGNA